MKLTGSRCNCIYVHIRCVDWFKQAWKQIPLFLQILLEEKQRARRRQREALQAQAAEASAAGNHSEAQRLEMEATHSPFWFQKEYDTFSNTMMHVYKGGYWEGKAKGDFGKKFVNIFET